MNIQSQQALMGKKHMHVLAISAQNAVQKYQNQNKIVQKVYIKA